MVGIILDCRAVLFYRSIAYGTLPWQPIVGAKSSKSAYSPSLVAPSFQNRVEYCNSVFPTSTAMIWLHRVQIWWTLEFKRGKGVYPSSITSVATFVWRRHCCEQYWVLLFTRGVTAMPRGLHARLCHAFPVSIYFTCADGFTSLQVSNVRL